MEGIGFIALAIAAVLVGFFVVRQSKTKGRWGHRVAEPGLSTLRHVHARDPTARINCGSNVGRMDVPQMRLQGRQVWARADCTLRRHALLAYGRRVADADDA
jgi:hypothetical protein